jgi:hypothetical protein
MSIGLLVTFGPTLSALLLYLKSNLSTLDFVFDPLSASLWSKAFCLSSQAFWMQVLCFETWQS